jgi:hypothetical protein
MGQNLKESIRRDRSERGHWAGRVAEIVKWLSIVLGAATVETLLSTTAGRVITGIIAVLLYFGFLAFQERKERRGTAMVLQARLPGYSNVRFDRSIVEAQRHYKYTYPHWVELDNNPSKWPPEVRTLLRQAQAVLDRSQGGPIDERRFAAFVNMPLPVAFWIGTQLASATRDRIAVWGTDGDVGPFRETSPAYSRPTRIDPDLVATTSWTGSGSSGFGVAACRLEDRAATANTWMQVNCAQGWSLKVPEDISSDDSERVVNQLKFEIEKICSEAGTDPICVLLDLPADLAFALGMRLHPHKDRFVPTYFSQGSYQIVEMN